jgi:hypothetical protein
LPPFRPRIMMSAIRRPISVGLSEDRLRADVGRRLGKELSGFHAVVNDGREDRFIAAALFDDSIVVFATEVAPLVVNNADAVSIERDQLDVADNEGIHAVLGRLVACEDFVAEDKEPVDPRLHDLPEQLLLTVDVCIKASGEHPDCGGYVTHRCRCVTVRAEEPCR